MTRSAVLLPLLAAGSGTALARRLADRATAGSRGVGARWTRTNHRGEPVSLLEGPAVAAGLLAGSLTAGATGTPGRRMAAAALAVTGGAVLGLVDDLSEDLSRTRKGLRGHLGALAHGELTTGGLKVVGIGAASLAAAAIGLPRRPGSSAVAHVVDVLGAGALVAGTANLVNLLDLRPGRALKGGALLAAPALLTPAAPLAAVGVGAVAAALPRDLAERDMLGDGGANSLGALVGAAAAFGLPRPLRLLALSAVMGLTVASERVSFTAVIERTPALRRLDDWGRRRAPLP